MKIITDFDGTLTHVDKEYVVFRKLFDESLTELGQVGDSGRELLHEASKAVASMPDKLGWMNNKRISQFCDEDPFGIVHGLSGFMAIAAENEAHPSHALAVKVLNALKEKNGDENYSFGLNTRHCYQAMVELTPPAPDSIDPEAAEAIEKLLDRSYEIVVVTNSDSTRVMAKLEAAGLKPVNHEENPSACFRVRGQSRKFWLGDEAKTIDVNGRTVDVNRPSYRKIIEDERPIAIVGDIFSLDLALPWTMIQEDATCYGELQLYLRPRAYTPKWSMDFMQAQLNENVHSVRCLLPDYRDLTSLLRKYS